MQPMNLNIAIDALKSKLGIWDDYFIVQLCKTELW